MGSGFPQRTGPDLSGHLVGDDSDWIPCGLLLSTQKSVVSVCFARIKKLLYQLVLIQQFF